VLGGLSLGCGRLVEAVAGERLPGALLVHLGLGDANQAAAVPRCADVLRLARLPGVTTLATATRPTAI
jgi:hypothetical protein